MDLSSYRRPHLIGIGGIGVSGVARALHAAGFAVRGSDVRESSITQALAREGIPVTLGQREENLGDADLVVYSTAVPETNPERQAARRRGLPLVHRSEVLGALTRGRESIGVIGTHGKGTVAAMITWILESAGQSPSFVIGGLLENFGTNARYASDGPIVVEIDESDGSLVNVPVRHVLVNNLEADHLNYYKNGLDDVLVAVKRFLRRNPEIHTVFANADDRGACEAMALSRQAFTSFGMETQTAQVQAADVTVTGLQSRFTVLVDDAPLGSVTLSLPGRYNVANAIGAIALTYRLGVPFVHIKDGIETFRGLENRFTVVEVGNNRVVKDYISHPTGIRRVLEAAREASAAPIVAVFKPYRFTMVNYLQDDYATAFRDAARTVITELYPAGEVPIPGIDAAFLCDRVRAAGSDVTFVPRMDDIVAHLLETVPDGSQVIFFGGDDLFALADHYAALLQGRAQ